MRHTHVCSYQTTGPYQTCTHMEAHGAAGRDVIMCSGPLLVTTYDHPKCSHISLKTETTLVYGSIHRPSSPTPAFENQFFGGLDLRRQSGELRSVQRNATHTKAWQHNTKQHKTTPHHTTQEVTPKTQHDTAQHKTTQHTTTQHTSTQHKATQHNTTQHNTTHHKVTERTVQSHIA